LKSLKISVKIQLQQRNAKGKIKSFKETNGKKLQTAFVTQQMQASDNSKQSQ